MKESAQAPYSTQITAEQPKTTRMPYFGLMMPAENAISTLKEAEKKLEAYNCSIEQINIDSASVFIVNKNEDVSEFQKYCEGKGIKLIPSGGIEKFGVAINSKGLTAQSIQQVSKFQRETCFQIVCISRADGNLKRMRRNFSMPPVHDKI